MAVVHLTAAAFDRAVEQGIALVDFWATWCGPCRMLAPTIEELGTEYEGKALIAKVDVDREPELAQRFGVMTIPTVVVLDGGKELERKIGLLPKEVYTEVLDSLL